MSTIFLAAVNEGISKLDYVETYTYLSSFLNGVLSDLNASNPVNLSLLISIVQLPNVCRSDSQLEVKSVAAYLTVLSDFFPFFALTLVFLFLYQT